MSGTWTDLSRLAPELAVALGAVLALALEVSLPRGSRRAPGIAALLALLAALVAVVVLWSQNEGIRSQPLFWRAGSRTPFPLVRDSFSLLMDIPLLLAAVLGVLLSLRYVEREAIPAGEYYALLLFATLGAMLLAASAELITLFISYEVLSVSVYVLTGIARGRSEAAEASLKYFLLGAFSSGFLVYGVALVYGATGTTGLESIQREVVGRGLQGSGLLLAGLALVAVGFAFKLAIVPFHAWVPDVYQGAPLPVTAYMSAAVKVAAFAALLRVLFSAFAPLSQVWQPALWVLAVLTMVLGNTAAIAQTNIKRMLAYSSIAHAGYMLVGVAAHASGDLALGSVVYYGLVYTAMGIGAFAAVVTVGREGEENQDLSHYSGLALRQPWTAGLMTLFMVSLAGLPPTAGFLGKFYILSAAVRADMIGLAVVLVLASLVSWYYYLRVVWHMYMLEPEHDTGAVSRARSLRTASAVAAVLVVLLGVVPSVPLHVSQMVAFPLIHLGAGR